MLIGAAGDATAARCARQEADLHQIRLVHVLQRDGLLTDGGGQRVQTDGATVVKANDRGEHSAVDVVKTQGIDLQLLQGKIGDLRGDGAIALDLCKVAHAL